MKDDICKKAIKWIALTAAWFAFVILLVSCMMGYVSTESKRVIDLTLVALSIVAYIFDTSGILGKYPKAVSTVRSFTLIALATTLSINLYTSDFIENNFSFTIATIIVLYVAVAFTLPHLMPDAKDDTRPPKPNIPDQSQGEGNDK